MDRFRVVLLVGALALGGCATMAQESARKEAMAECAAQGKRYLEVGANKREGVIISTGTVSYQCVGPNDPGYADAMEPAA